MKTIEEYLAMNYRKAVFKDEDGPYIAEVDDLTGCIADGETEAEALRNLEGAMRAWMESRIAAGVEIPEPRATQEFSGKTVLRMPRYLHRRLVNRARQEGVSLNQYIVSLLAEGSTHKGEEGLEIFAQAAPAATQVVSVLGGNPTYWEEKMVRRLLCRSSVLGSEQLASGRSRETKARITRVSQGVGEA
jgi:predicted RNase H-like HicB family nuclease